MPFLALAMMPMTFLKSIGKHCPGTWQHLLLIPKVLINKTFEGAQLKLLMRLLHVALLGVENRLFQLQPRAILAMRRSDGGSQLPDP